MTLEGRWSAELALVLALALATACNGQGGNANAPSAQDLATLAPSELSAAALPASPTNAHADESAAVSLGRLLFFDKRMSEDATVSCASCHDPAQGFSDPRPVSIGVFGRTGTRHSMPAIAVSFHPYLFWDGRADSVWSQPLKAIEGHAEMDFTRVEVARFVAAEYGSAYAAIFGPLPDMSTLPTRAAPGLPAWDEMSESDQDGVNRVFSNVGKALEAYERKLLCNDTRFDGFLAGTVTLTAAEADGASDFVQGGCTKCHDGPTLSDGKFHAIGVGDGSDVGRSAGIQKLLADPFNGSGAYSDDTSAGAALIAAAAAETPATSAFRTPTLRGVGQRSRFGHDGGHTSLTSFITDTYDRGRGRGRNGGGGAGLDPLLAGVDPGNVDDVVAFLHTLDCPALPAELLAP